MVSSKELRIAVQCGAGIIASLFWGVTDASAEEDREEAAFSFDEIIVSGRRAIDDPTEIAPDAASLLATPGDVNDPLKALQSLPGITFGGNDLDDPVIRGGGPRDNLYLVDGIPVGNVFHELSDSIVSPNVIRTFDLQSAAFSPQYGNATGGVIDIGLRDPSLREQRVNLDLSQFKSGFLVETPITNRIGLYGAFRQNLAHLFLEEFERGNDALVFQMPESRDYTARALWRGQGTDISFTALGSWDKTEETPRDENLANLLGVVERRQLNAQSIRLRSSLSNSTDLTVTVSHSAVNENRRDADGSFGEFNSNIYTLRSSLTHQMSDHSLQVGVNYTYSDNELSFRGFIPIRDRLEQVAGAIFSPVSATLEDLFQSTELFVSDQISLSNRATIDVGIHTAIDHFLEETFFEPRLGVTYKVMQDVDLYARFGRHHVSPPQRNLIALGDLAGQQESERSSQAMIGARWAVADGWRVQTEAWYKDFRQKELIGTPLENEFEGITYGLDILLAKPIGEHLYGWAALSLSESEITLTGSDLSIDNQFSPPVSATIALSYAFDSGWRIGAKYRAQSGDPYTPLSSVSTDPETGAPSPVFGIPFSERLSAYHRFDIRLEKSAQYRFGDVTYYADILNVFDRTNVGNRDFPIRNTVLDPTNGAVPTTILPDDDEGIPFFIAFGVNLEF